jgi:hypothetical protein
MRHHAVLVIALLFVVSFLVHPRFVFAEDARILVEKPDVKISLAVPERGRQIATSPLHVIIQNISDKPQSHFDEWNSWGYGNLSLHWTDSDGKTGTVTKVARGWDRNGPTVTTLQPGEALVREISFDPELWHGWPEATGEFTLTVIVTYRATGDPVVPNAAAGWTGTVSSNKRAVIIWRPNVSVSASPPAAFTYEDAIDRLVKKLGPGGSWTNGLSPEVGLPADAKPEDIIAEAVKNWGPAGQRAAYRVLHIQSLKFETLVGSASAALIQNDAGTRILIFYPFRTKGWWTRFYDTDLASATTQPSSRNNEAVDRLVDKLNASHGGWGNGRRDSVQLPEDATANEVIGASLQIADPPFSEVKTHRVLSVCNIEKLVAPGRGPWSAALLETNLGPKILIWGFQGDKSGWWVRLHDAETTAPTSPASAPTRVK